MKADSMSNDQTPEVGAMLLEDTQSVITFFIRSKLKYIRIKIKMTLKIKRSAHQMRKTEHKMSDLSVTGSNVSSGYKTRSQMARSATQPAQQRPQRRYNSALHKVRLISS